jgi:glycosyltransferase involved in cell wall biosynthesis
MPPSSVILCTHNPREDFLRRTLAGLEAQRLPKERWEFLLVDNASSQKLEHRVDLSWHPSGKIVREDDLGLTAARFKGIRASKGELLVFVDDDNVLREDYLDQAFVVSQEWPFLGAWGGSILPWFETEPSAKARSCLALLAVREVKKPCWSNFPDRYDLLPWGAGLCIRRRVAEEWVLRASQDAVRRSLDRRGASLFAQGDDDLALTACDLGMGTGLFPELSLTHLLPSRRLEPAYLRKLGESITYSVAILRALRSGQPPREPSVPRRIWKALGSLRQGLWSFQMHLSTQRGFRSAIRDWRERTCAARLSQPC